jgi:hypothetical protein
MQRRAAAKRRRDAIKRSCPPPTGIIGMARPTASGSLTSIAVAPMVSTIGSEMKRRREALARCH